MELSRRGSDIRRIVAVALGLLLWLQLAANPMARELSYPDTDYRRVVVYLLPVLLLAIATFARNVIVSLLLFPTSFGAVLVVMPRSITGALASMWSFALTALTLVGYVLTMSAWLQEATSSDYIVRTTQPVRSRRDRWRPYRGTYAPRAALLVALFVVTVAAVPLYPDLVARVARSFGSASDPHSVEKGIILCNLVVFLSWSVLAYALFFVPALEMESRVRHLETQMQASLARTRARGRKLWLILAVALAAITLTGLVLMRMQ